MNRLIELVIRIADLVEAEGRVAKEHVIRVVVGVLVFILAAMLMLLAVIALAVSSYLALRHLLRPEAAVAIVGAVFAAGSVLCATVGRNIVMGRRTREGEP